MVIGGGPAGTSTAIALARSGVSVLVAERRAKRADTFGESLPPSVRPLLHQLGVWEAFLATGPRPCYGNRSSWGGDGRVVEHDFIRDRHGHGWTIDRGRFEAMLQEEAERADVCMLRGARIDAVERDGNGPWRLLLEESKGRCVVTASFAVDASGRVAAFAREQGAKRRRIDRLIAATALLQADGDPLCESESLVEAVRDGWWYSAPVRDGRLAVAFFTDPDLAATQLVRTDEGWWTLVSECGPTRERIESCGYRLIGRPRLVAAGSGVLDRISGHGWVAVGDASVTHDPLSSHGIGAALDGGIRAALAVRGHLGGDAEALSRYAGQVYESYARYLLMWRAYYAQERRWRDAPFWRRRQWVGHNTEIPATR